ncbi:MAG: 4'-phosphopantetheinyl transferase superfamily protein [Prevotella sp.]|nr:4'-phosphopantetheinyl transferase superfamily protein [Prevotella sp.]
MPLYRDEKIGDAARLCIWQITESIEDLPMPLQADLSALHSESRRREVMAIYALLSYMTDRTDLVICHDSTGRPILPGWNLSISHTKGWAVLVMSRTKAVAVDIEFFSDRVSRVTDRFVRPDENKDSLEVQLINWSAKETVFKFLYDEDLEYFEMRLKSFDRQPKGRVEVEDLKCPKSVWVDFEVTPDYVLTYAVEP